MSNIAEIEAAIENLPDPQVVQLSRWLEQLRQRRTALPPVENWLKRACGVARPGTSTEELLKLTRSEE